MDLLKGLSLFSGIGGLDIALREWVEPVAYCEIEPYCQSVLLSRMQEGDLPKAPIWDDIRTLSTKGESGLPEGVDIIYGGFPCQDISVAGRGKGLGGERSGLFFEIMRLAEEIKPAFIFLENVGQLRTRGLDRVLYELTKERYDIRWCTLPASDVGAIHRRKRMFILAHNRSERIQGVGEKEVQRKFGISRGENERRAKEFRERSNLHTPRLCGSGNGIPFRMERTHALGNSVCPLQTRIAFEILMGLN